MATETTPIARDLEQVFPLGSRVDERGHLEVGGCDVLELAREFGTPAYVVAEDDLRARARAFLAAGRRTGHEDLHVVFASKAFPCTAVLALFAEEGLWCDVASGGELHLALNAGFAPERIVLHGNAKSETELRMALDHRVGLVVVDNLDEVDVLARLLADDAQGESPSRAAHAPPGRTAHVRSGAVPHAALPSQKTNLNVNVLIRVTPDVRGDTHEKISTGQADSKFGFGMDEAAEAIARIEAVAGLELAGVHAHIGSQLLELEPFRRELAQLAGLRPALAPLGSSAVWDVGGGLGVAYVADQRPPAIEDYVAAVVEAAREHLGEHARLLVEPGRALTANAGVTLYTVQSVKRNVSTWVAVDGGMSDNLRPMLYGSVYEAHVADRLGGRTRCVLAGKHCESGDVIVRDALLDDPRPGDVIVTPATGAYGYALCNTYNGVPRPPVVFCRDGDARVVVRRESYEDLTARDVP
jgi:diaminopimelate decarboxylase